MIKVHKLSRPGKYNSLTLEMIEALSEQVASPDGSRVLILIGDENHFSSGADLKGDFFKIFEKLAHLYRQIQNSSKIVIAAIDGYCLAGGFGLAAAADLALATPEAVFQLPECRRGLIAPLAASLSQNLLPRRLLLELTLSGEPLSSSRLYEAG